ncbi:phosphodiester glycosidase family protein [Pedobacter nutrimenti]|jgi:exopolysaccharide biosynthesis protein|uniref:Uncharacterized protein DUF2233 n=1 Tax=Pedobacter nutrimenti TaxID=1241337 RepID=A0A318UI59_9SPHI|nr:phosphodiester glycosidase family protein [Pedobacter nutrimenti]PYF75783.1 uncharacterized protein DUF2233 [Pedobacter nutrimenti]
MLKFYFSSLLLFLGASVVFAQHQDSLTLVSAHWTKKKIAPKTFLFSFHFEHKDLFLSNQNINYIAVKRARRSPVPSFGYEVRELRSTSSFGEKNQAIAAINGTFFDVKNGGSVDFLKINGTIISKNKLEKNSLRAKHQQAALVIKNQSMDIQKWDGTDSWENEIEASDVMLSGPLLTLDSQDQLLDSTSFSKSRHPRSSIGLKPDGTLILLTVDGRNENSAGMSLEELRKVMRWIGCKSIINLDGGGSTTLWIKNFPENGIVNYPTDNKKWDHGGERKVANVILLKKKP